MQECHTTNKGGKNLNIEPEHQAQKVKMLDQTDARNKTFTTYNTSLKQTDSFLKVRVCSLWLNWSKTNMSSVIRSNTSCNSWSRLYRNKRQIINIFTENLKSCPSRVSILRDKNISSKYERAKTNRKSSTYDRFNTGI